MKYTYPTNWVIVIKLLQIAVDNFVMTFYNIKRKIDYKLTAVRQIGNVYYYNIFKFNHIQECGT